MSTSTRISGKRLKRKDLILQAAMQMLSEYGIDGLTVHKLASALDLTPGALYRYFPSKAKLVLAIEVQVLDGMSERLADELRGQQVPDDPGQAALVRLWVCAQFYLREPDDHPEHAKVIAALLGDPRVHVDNADLSQVSAPFFKLFHPLAELFEQASRHGALCPGDSRSQALTLWAALQGACALQKLRRVDNAFFDPRRVGSELARTLLLGWGAKPSDLDACQHDRGKPE